MDVNDIELKIPGTEEVLKPGYKVKLGRFTELVWTVGFGWYSYGGNRPICGWYLTTDWPTTMTKSLQYPDLTDIYIITVCADTSNEDTADIPEI